MKSIINKFLIFSITFLMFGCAENFVETDPTQSVPGESLIVDVASAESALTGMYDALQFTRVFGGYDLFGTGLYADELVHTGSFPSFAEVGSNDPALNNNEVTNYWSTHYAAIYRANLILSNIDRPNLGFSDEVKARIGGQARGVRALLYYKLVKIYGGVPLIPDAFTSATDIDVNPVARSSASEVYNFILSNITTAEAELPDGLGLFRFNKNAARVLKAKIEMELGDYASAKTTLEPVLTSYSLANTYAELFGDVASGTPLSANATEGIFAIDFNDTDGGNQGFFFLNAGRGEVGASPKLIATFENGDLRKSLISGAGEVTKYQDAGNGSDDVYVYRFADVLLMQSELLAREGNYTSASSFLNQVRTRAGLGDITLDASNYVNLIAQERFVELFAESSDRLFTITRLGLANDIISNKTGSVFVATRNNLWPIPQQEIERNSAISATNQNPGY